MEERKTKFVVVNDCGDAKYSFGVYNDLLPAIGKVMLQIWDTFTDYRKSDEYEVRYEGPFPMEAEEGWAFKVIIKHKGTEEQQKEYYYILEVADCENLRDENGITESYKFMDEIAYEMQKYN